MTRRRHLTAALLCFLLGAITTVAVAWALARFRPLPMYPRTVARAFIADGRAWSTAEVHVLGGADIWWDDLGGQQPPPSGAAAMLKALVATPSPPSKKPLQQLIDEARRTYAEVAAERPDFVVLDGPPSWGTLAAPPPYPGASQLGEDAAFGFPLPCLWYQVISIARGNASLGATFTGGILLSGSPNARATGSYTALPFRPIWPALLINTAALTLAWWLLLAGRPMARRAICRRRGLCPNCAYDLRATPPGAPCPECGATAPRSQSGLSPS